MALIFNTFRTGSQAVVEDPRPGQDYIYLDGFAYDHLTLSPIFGKTLLNTTSSVRADSVTGYNTTTEGYVYDEHIGRYTMDGMALSKGVAQPHHVHQAYGSYQALNSEWNTGFSETPVHRHMDPMYKNQAVRGPAIYYESNNEHIVSSSGGFNRYYNVRYWAGGASNNMHDNPVVAGASNSTANAAQTGDGSFRTPFAYNANFGNEYQPLDHGYWTVGGTGYYIGGGNRSTAPSSNAARRPDDTWGYEPIWVASGNDPSTAALSTNLTDPQASYRWQHITSDACGTGNNSNFYIFLRGKAQNHKDHIIKTYDPTSNSVTTIASFNTLSVERTDDSEYQQGGYSGTMEINLPASNWFRDDSKAGTGDSEDVCWYVPNFDENHNFFPWLFKWDISSDTFTRDSDVRIVHNNNGYHKSDTSGLFKSIYQAYTHNGEYFNNAYFTPCKVIKNSGNRYLTVYNVSGKKGATDYDADSLAQAYKNIVSYQISSADPNTLTYHSHLQLPQCPINNLYLDDYRKLWAVICHSNTYILKWDNTNGWVNIHTIAGQVWSIGRDKRDRIWYIVGDGNGYSNVYMLQETIPVNITLTSAANTYNYTGSDINTTVTVSATNFYGNRIAADVLLTITGNSMNFAGNTTTTVTTTASGAQATAALTITGSGFASIKASVAI